MSKVYTGHVIARYFALEDRIICACGWEGNAEKPWAEHKKAMKEIMDIVPPEKQVLRFGDMSESPMGISTNRTRKKKKQSENSRMLPREWEIMIDA